MSLGIGESQPRIDSTLVKPYGSQHLIFFVFIINFVVIIGADSKFGVDLSTQAAKSYNTKTTVKLPSVGRFTTEMEMFWLRIQPVMPFTLSCRPAMCQRLKKNSMSKIVSLTKLLIFLQG